MSDIRFIFEENIKLLGIIDRTVLAFREGRYDEALETIAGSGDGINIVCDAVFKDREYFKAVSTESVGRMLNDIIEARHKKDYVLLADLYELQLAGFIGRVQELILDREDFLDFNIDTYNNNIRYLELKLEAAASETAAERDDDEARRLLVNRNASLEAPLSPEHLLEAGYSVEFTACGLMTLKAPREEGEPIYLHTNASIVRESALLARTWYRPGVRRYIVYGFGLGYHIAELLRLDPAAEVLVFESDINILKLYAAFTEAELLHDSRVSICLDEDRAITHRILAGAGEKERVCIHYPSLRRLKTEDELYSFVPKGRGVEKC